MPSSARARMFSHGKVPSMYLSARGRNSFCARSRTVATKRRCSSDKLTNTVFLPCFSQQAEVAQAGVPAAADYQMVVHGHAERLRRLDDVLGDGDVGLRRAGVAGGVVVHQDQCRGLELERALDDLARVDG